MTRSTTVRTVRADLYWENVARGADDACWLWTGCRMGGYGVYREQNQVTRAHRLAYELRHGEVPPGHRVLRRCKHPLCCNPAHLYLGTSSPPPRQPRRPHRRHRKLRPTEVAAIRARCASGEPRAAVARAYGITPTWIGHLLRRSPDE